MYQAVLLMKVCQKEKKLQKYIFYITLKVCLIKKITKISTSSSSYNRENFVFYINNMYNMYTNILK